LRWLAEVVECRFFGGLTEEETAQALDSSVRTIQREWVRARAWLFRELSPVVNPTTSKV
jgi:DNA-directed RNA polymerase specialized sigma24 family protein